MRKIDLYLQYMEYHASHQFDQLLAMMADDIVFYAAAGMAGPMRGKAVLRQWLEQSAPDVHDPKWRVIDHAETESTLFVEGIEEHHSAAGQHLVIPYAGVYEFRGDLVCAWRDYFHGGLLRHGTEQQPVRDHVQELARRSALSSDV